MPGELQELSVVSGGRRVRLLRGGSGPPVVLLHGGWTGNALYCGASDIWAPLAELLLPGHDVIAIDVPGNGGSEVGAVADLTLAAARTTVADVLGMLGLPAVHLVGHAEGGLLALMLAAAGGTPGGPRVLSCTLVQPIQASPTGDSIQDVTLLHPPLPLFSAASQAWALDRHSATPHHIDDALLDRLAAHAGGAPHRTALRLLTGEHDLARVTDLTRGRLGVFAQARGEGFDAPIALVWSPDDPLSGAEFGAGTLDYLAGTPHELSLTLVPRCGHFPFREDPRAVARVVLPMVARHEPVPA